MSQNDEINSLPPTIKRYLRNLQSPNPRQRSHAAAELGKSECREAVPALIEALTEDVNTYVRTAAAESLGHLGDERAIFPLMDALQDPCSFVRRAAAIALGQLQAKEAQVALLHALEDSNFYVRRAAINAIGKLGIPDLGRVLLPLLELDDARMRRTTITALRRLGTKEAVQPMIEMLDTYLEAPAKRDLPVVKTLVVALGKMKAREAVPVLTQVLRGYVGARSIAAKALGKIGDSSAVPALVEALQGQSAGLRLAALKSLRTLDGGKAMTAVRELLTSPDPRFRREAAITAAQLGDETTIPHLLKMAREDPSPLARPAAVEALGYYNQSELAEELLPLVEDANAYVRAALAPTLGRLYRGSPTVRAALERLAEDQVRHVAARAQETLAELPHNVEGRGGDGRLSAVTEKMPGWLQRLLHRD